MSTFKSYCFSKARANPHPPGGGGGGEGVLGTLVGKHVRPEI